MVSNQKPLQLIAITIAFIYCSLITVSAQADKYLGEASKVKEQITKEANQLFKKKEWKKLDELFDNAREQRTILSNGWPVLDEYYEALEAKQQLKDTQPDKKWLEYLEMLNKWEKAAPKSLAVKALKIEFWCSFGWKARGKGYAHTVTKKGFHLLAVRLEKASDLYQALKVTYPDGIPCPRAYLASLTTALGVGWQNQETLEELVMPVVKSWPEYYPMYAHYAYRLEAKWYGKDLANYKFYNDLKTIIGGDTGMKTSAIVLVTQLGPSINSFRRDLVDWEDIKAGFLIHIKQHPHSEDLIRQFIVFGSRYEPIKELASYVEKTSPEAYKNFTENLPYGELIAATLATTSSPISLDYYSRPTTSPLISRINYASSHKNLDYYIYSQTEYGLAIVNAEDGAILKHRKPTGQKKSYYNSLALSPSGKYICTTINSGTRGTINIYEYSNGSLKEVKKISAPLNYIHSVVFTENESTILFAGRPWPTKGRKAKKVNPARLEGSEKQSCFYKWNWQKENPKLVNIIKRDNTPRTVIVPGSSKVFCYSGETCFSYDYNDKKSKATPLKLSFDGKKSYILDAFYVEELNSIAVLDYHNYRIALLDPQTFEPHFNQKDLPFITQPYRFTGYADKDGYTFCVTGAKGYLSTLTYNKEKETKIEYQSTWVNSDFHPITIGLSKGTDGTPKIVQTYFDGMISAYSINNVKQEK